MPDSAEQPPANPLDAALAALEKTLADHLAIVQAATADLPAWRQWAQRPHRWRTAEARRAQSQGLRTDLLNALHGACAAVQTSVDAAGQALDAPD